MNETIVRYGEDYIESCFYAWYKAGHPRASSENGSHIIKHLPRDPDGRKPHIITVRGWMDKYGWEQRADALDAQVSLKLDKEAITARVKTLKELAKSGEELANKGLDYLRKTENPFLDNPSAAVRAIVSGAEMRFKYEGAAEYLANITSMSDKQLEREIYRMLGRNENVIDADSEDVPSENDDSSDES